MSKENIKKLNELLNEKTVQEKFQNCLGSRAKMFISSITNLYSSDKRLVETNPSLFIKEALKAATLKLPLEKGLGYAYIGIRNKTPRFIIGYKGYIQLALRSKRYKYINADVLYEGQEIVKDQLTGKTKIEGKPKASAKPIAYFAYIETLEGYSKSIVLSKEEIIEHAKRFSAAYDRQDSAWKTDFEAMALKTVLKKCLMTYGLLDVQLESALVFDENEIEEHFESQKMVDLDFPTEDVIQEDKKQQ